MARTEETDLGRRIALARRELGLTQRELADRIGVMLGVLVAYETGMADPSPRLDRIAEATGKDTIWFLRGDDPEEMGARLQLHASELARREAALRRKEDELALAHKRAEERLRELDELETRRSETSGDLEPRQRALSTREAELERAASELAERTSAFEAVEREFKESRLRQAEETRRIQAPLREREEVLAEQELERRQAELAGWVQTADRVATELQHSLVTLEHLRHKASADRAGAVSERAELELRALDVVRREKEQKERSAQLEASAAALDERARKLEEMRNDSAELERARAEAVEREATLSERERELTAREEATAVVAQELTQRLRETRERAQDQEQLAGKEAEAFAELRRIESQLHGRQYAVARKEVELAERAKALEERGTTLEREQRELEDARAEAARRLAGVRDGVRATIAELEAQLAQQDRVTVEAPSRPGAQAEKSQRSIRDRMRRHTR
jgi:DNA-binding XRE family transcriptional regulator